MSIELPSGMFVRPVEGNDDLFAFNYGFGIKALDDESATVTETEDGDLIIDGYAAVFEGLDREGENFHNNSFQRGIKAFLNSQASLCYHHKFDKCLGKVLDLGVDGKGLHMRARVDGAIRSHPELGTYYEQIKKGTLNALSVGGFFKRAMVDGLQKIVGVDFTEISVTPVPVHPGTNFAVVAGKALASDVKDVKELEVEGEIRQSDLEQINWMIDELNGVFDRIQEGLSQRKQANNDQPSE